MGNILEPNDIGYGEDGDEESNLEHQRTRDFNKTNEFKNWQNKNLLLNEDQLAKYVEDYKKIDRLEEF